GLDPHTGCAIRIHHVGHATMVALSQKRLATEGKHEGMGEQDPDGASYAQGEGDHCQYAQHAEGTVARLGAEERARDRSRREHGSGAGSQARERALLLSQRAGGQLEAELLDRFGHTTVLSLAVDGIRRLRAHHTCALLSLHLGYLHAIPVELVDASKPQALAGAGSVRREHHASVLASTLRRSLVVSHQRIQPIGLCESDRSESTDPFGGVRLPIFPSGLGLPLWEPSCRRASLHSVPVQSIA